MAMEIQWYPGHMTKARRAMEDNLKLIDVIIELVDARAPLSSRNPDIDRLGRQKYRMILMNKADLADEALTVQWESYFEEQGLTAVSLDSRTRRSMKFIQSKILEVSKEKRERDQRRGIRNRPVRAMICGIPNVGKSTFINSFTGKASTKTGNKPGVTRGNQWIRLSSSVELLDTPGILWPKFEDPAVGERLALIGSVSDEIVDPGELALFGISLLKERYPDQLAERYPGVDLTAEDMEILAQIAQVRGCLAKGGTPDYGRAAKLFLDDLRSGRIGRLTCETPPAEERS